MGRITVRTTIEAPAEAVFDRLADLERMPEYSTLTRAVSTITPGPVRRGTRWTEANPVGPILTTGEWTVRDYDRPTRLGFEGTSAFVDARVGFDLEAVDGRTRLEQVTEFEFLSRLGPVGPVLERRAFTPVLAKQQRRSMLRFKRLVETERAEAAAAAAHERP